MITMSGKDLAAEIRANLAIEIAQEHLIPRLAVIQVGENEASSKYIKMKGRACDEVGIGFEHIQLAADVADENIQAYIDELNLNDSVTGIIVQLPLPKRYDTEFILEAISPNKDVDGLTRENEDRLQKHQEGLYPATAEGVINLLRYYNITLKGANTVVLGRSRLVGKPIAKLLEFEGAKVTVCHSKTPDIGVFTKKADIIVSAVGKHNLITADMVKAGAVVVDVGMDVDFEGVSAVAGYLTPPTGAVGPMTVAMLLSNVIKAARVQK